MINLFLDEDFSEYRKQTDCIHHLFKQMRKALDKDDYKTVAVYHENIARSYRELAELKQRKINHDELELAVDTLKEIGIDFKKVVANYVR